MRNTCLGYYVPCVTPVQAGEYRDVSSLEEFVVWVDRYRGLGFVDDDVQFTVQRDHRTIGVLHTGLGTSEMEPGDFLVFTGRAFFVSPPAQFWRDYRDLDSAITLPRTDPRANCTS